jgi:hypothetical protein
MTRFRKKALKPDGEGADNRYVGNYDELDTARLTWVVLDRLVPPDDEPAARTALIARDPELRSLVLRGMLSEKEAVEIFAERRGRRRRRRRIIPAVLLLVVIAVWLVLRLL